MEFKNVLTTNGGGQQVLNETKVDNLLVIFSYSFKEFLRWWYIKMPLWHFRMIGRIMTFVDDSLSISLLLKNFLLPWHRDASMIGYFFGLLIKLLYLPIAVVALLAVNLIYLLVILLWILLPLATVFFIFRSFLRI